MSRAIDEIRANLMERLVRNYKYGAKAAPLRVGDEEILARWNFTDNLIRKGHSRKFVVSALCQTYGDISISTAYNDYNNAKVFFGSMSLQEKEYETMLQLEWIEKGIRAVFETNNLRILPALLKERRLLRNLGLDDVNKIPIDVLIQKNIFIQVAGETQPVTIPIDGTDVADTDIEKLLNSADILSLPPDKLKEILNAKTE